MTAIKFKRSSVTGKIPTTGNLTFGELALNYADGILYYLNTSSIVQSIGSVQSTPLTISTTTNSISTTSGALVVAGGVGIGSNVNIGGKLDISYSSSSSPSLKISGVYSGTARNIIQITNLDTSNGNLAGVTITSGSTSATGQFASWGVEYSGVSGFAGKTGITNTTGTGALIAALNNPIYFYTGVWVERMQIDNSGNVGIGTSSPGARLDIQSTTAGSTTGVLKLYGVNGSDRYTGIDFHGVTSETYNKLAQITAVVTGGGTGGGNAITGDLIFRTNYSASNTCTERMRIDSLGNVGIGTTSTTYKLQVVGSFAATTISFVIDHPTKSGMKLRYGSLEGPENGVYVRGRLTDSDTIQLPEYWTKLIDPNSITVNLTPVDSYQELYVKDIKDNKIIINNKSSYIDCFYIIFAERADVEKLQVES